MKKPKLKLKRWVVKVGSNIVCSGGPILLRAWMQQVLVLRKKHNIEVIWVTSGAIASAVERTGFKKRNRLLTDKQALSAIGQPLIMDLYNIALQSNGLLGAQILLTYSDLSDKLSLDNFKGTIEKLLEWSVVPILNENDAVATEEIKFGDNDRLSAQVANHVEADRLVILTDVKGLYNSNPTRNPRARFVKEVVKVTPRLLSKVSPSSGTERGTGGMFSKLSAAKYAAEHSIETWLIKGDLPNGLTRIAQDLPVGTVVRAKNGLNGKKTRNSR